MGEAGMKPDLKPKNDMSPGKFWGTALLTVLTALTVSVGLWMLPLRCMVGLFLGGIFLACLCLLLGYYFPAPEGKEKSPLERRGGGTGKKE